MAIWDNLAEDKGWLVGPDRRHPVFVESEPACSMACPAGVDIKSYINLIADGRFEAAVAVIKRMNPFPGVCGRVCTHPCEESCKRGEHDDPLAIRELKRFAADYDLARKEDFARAPQPRYREKVAIVGAGPAGLTAAADLSIAGFPVTVFDAAPVPGGVMAWGIPDFRLPKNILSSEIRDIMQLGVDIQCNSRVDDPTGLLDKGYSAVVLATGSGLVKPLGIEGEDAGGVMDCLDFLLAASRRKAPSMPGKTLVIGGGSAALDAARTAKRLGADVTVAYRRTDKQMPVADYELEEAIEERVKFEYLAIPISIEKDSDGNVASMRFQRAALGEPDESGRRSPEPVPGDFFTIQADRIIRAVGSKPDNEMLVTGKRGSKLQFTPRGTLVVDDDGQTDAVGVFAAGDLVSGPASIVDAIGSGHTAARGVMKHLGKARDLEEKRTPPMLVVETPFEDRGKRPKMNLLAPSSRYKSFDEANLGWGEMTVLAEASRCRRCGSCGVCDVCLSVCEHKQAVATDLATGEMVLVKVPPELSARLVEEPDARNGWLIETPSDSQEVRLEPVTPLIDPGLCIACGRCDEACAYRAIRVDLKIGQTPRAVVDSEVCRSCGACAAACPTGAIEMGFMDEASISKSVKDAVAESGGGPISFSCIWHHPESGLNTTHATVPVICTRRLNPALILQALASGASGVALIGCKEGACHYLPGPRMGPDVAAGLRAILDSVGLDMRRIRYMEGSGNLEGQLAYFKGELSEADLGPLVDAEETVRSTRSPLGRAINLIKPLIAQADRPPGAESAEVMILTGCLDAYGPIYRSYGLATSENALSSARKLFGTPNIAFVSGISIPNRQLRETRPELFTAYSRSIVDAVKNCGAKKLGVLTPASFEIFRNDYDDIGAEIVSGPALLCDAREITQHSGLKVGYYTSAPGSAFTSDSLALLERAGREVQVFSGDIGDTTWQSPDAAGRERALDLLNRVESTGISILIVESPQSLAHLEFARMGWDESRVRCVDIYSFIMELSGGIGP